MLELDLARFNFWHPLTQFINAWVILKNAGEVLIIKMGDLNFCFFKVMKLI